MNQNSTDTQPPEQWTPIVGFEGRYEVSNMGQVRSLSRPSPGIMRLYTDPAGRPRINLWLGGRYYRKKVHRLVLEAFVGPCPPEKECAHINGNPSDNRVSNLAWVTHAENESHKKIHGTDNVGERNPSARLTKGEVAEIRREYAKGGISQSLLGSRHGVTPSHISDIIRGQKWPSVTGSVT